jgi:hypothetical protein
MVWMVVSWFSAHCSAAASAGALARMNGQCPSNANLPVAPVAEPATAFSKIHLLS